MEPMTLGSPVGSPSSPPTSPFLPAFLMGEPATTPGAISMTKGSPMAGKQQVSFVGTPTVASSPPPLSFETRARPTPTVLHAGEKASGPPIRGLYDAEEAPFPGGAPAFRVHPLHDASSLLDVTPPLAQVASPAQSATFSVSTPTVAVDGGGHWVTVFGFPASAASHILAQFSQYGTVLSSRSSARGNWVHVKYQSAVEARKALSNNGKVYGGTFMVAVMPCRDPEVLLMDSVDKENQSFRAPPDGCFSPNASLRRTPTSAFRGADPNRTPAGGTPLTPRQTGVRPLTHAYRAAQQSTEVVCSHSMPQRSSGLVGKAMEYFFGW